MSWVLSLPLVIPSLRVPRARLTVGAVIAWILDMYSMPRSNPAVACTRWGEFEYEENVVYLTHIVDRTFNIPLGQKKASRSEHLAP